jgi:hypothetical protein
MKPFERFEVAFYVFLLVSVLLAWWGIKLYKQLSWAERLISKDGLMESVYLENSGRCR